MKLGKSQLTVSILLGSIVLSQAPSSLAGPFKKNIPKGDQAQSGGVAQGQAVQGTAVQGKSAQGKGQDRRARKQEPLENTLIVEEVRVDRHGLDERVSCDTYQFKGTHEKNTIKLRAMAEGGSGKYKHYLSYVFGEDGYELEPQEMGQHTVRVYDNVFRHGTVKLKLPKLKDKVPYVDQTVTLITEDKKTNATTSTQMTFRVSRTVMLQRSTDSENIQKNCHQIYAAYPAGLGYQINDSTSSMNVELKHGIQNNISRNHGWQTGVFFSPASFSFLGNMFMLNANYFRETSVQHGDDIQVGLNFTLEPGDRVQIYEQPTRRVTAMDAVMVQPCGETETLPGAYLMQTWEYSYPQRHIGVGSEPGEANGAPLSAIGMEPVNTCHEILPDQIDGVNLDFRAIIKK